MNNWLRFYLQEPYLRAMQQANKRVVGWLYLGVIMLMIQILLGGVTRLTESGLSITEWKPVTGTLPPMSESAWQAEFDKYKNTDQFRYIHADFSLSDFKNIFFWEWLHRNWARLMGLVFIAGFVYFLIRRQLQSQMIIPFIILFVLGVIQGAVGWIMVMSGLVPEKMYVGHIHLAAHFIAALLLLGYTQWFAMSLSLSRHRFKVSPGFRTFTLAIVVVLFFQLVYGAFMAGLHTATYAPTWPTINGQWWPAAMSRLTPEWMNWIENPIAIHFIHRTLAYLLALLVAIWYVRARKVQGSRFFRRVRVLPLVLVLLQLILGILAVITSPVGDSLIYFGVAHQFGGMLFLMSFILMLYLLRSKQHRAYENSR